MKFVKKIVSTVLATVCALGCFSVSACGKTEDLTVYIPDGAPALAFAKLMHEDTEEDGITYKVVAANLIKTKVTYKDDSKNADLCVLPLTAATKLLGSGENYQMLGVVTHGNLYLISRDIDTMYELNNLSDLCGKTVGVLQLNEVPGLIFKTVLHKAGIAYQENGETNANQVNLIPITGAQDVGVLDNVDLYLLAEPAISSQTKKGFHIVGDVQSLYGGENGYPQAVLVAKRSVIEKQRAKLVSMFTVLEETENWLLTSDSNYLEDHIAQAVIAVTSHLEDETYSTSLRVLTSSTSNSLDGYGTLDIVERCGIRYQMAQSAKEAVRAFITAAQAVNANMATMPNDAFFYNPPVEA